MRRAIAGLCLAAAMALVGCSSIGDPPESTARAIDSDISAAHNNGPTAEQIGQVPYPQVTSPHDNSVVPNVSVPINNTY